MIYRLVYERKVKVALMYPPHSLVITIMTLHHKIQVKQKRKQTNIELMGRFRVPWLKNFRMV